MKTMNANSVATFEVTEVSGLDSGTKKAIAVRLKNTTSSCSVIGRFDSIEVLKEFCMKAIEYHGLENPGSLSDKKHIVGGLATLSVKDLNNGTVVILKAHKFMLQKEENRDCAVAMEQSASHVFCRHLCFKTGLCSMYGETLDTIHNGSLDVVGTCGKDCCQHYSGLSCASCPFKPESCDDGYCHASDVKGEGNVESWEHTFKKKTGNQDDCLWVDMRRYDCNMTMFSINN